MTHFQEIEELLTDVSLSAKERYAELQRIFLQILTEGTAECRTDFSGPFARLTWIASHFSLEKNLYERLNQTRVRCRHPEKEREETLNSLFPYDLRGVAELEEKLSGEPIPQNLLWKFPLTTPRLSSKKTRKEYVRVCVDPAYLPECEEDKKLIPIRLGTEHYLLAWEGTRLWAGCQLNLIHPKKEGDIILPELVILEPDCLVDISTIASCFESYGTTPYALLIHRMQEPQSTLAILLGNLAGQMLDEELNNHTEEPIPYKESALRFMRRNALALLACQEDLSALHKNGKEQQQNLRTILDTLKEEECSFDRTKALLEPSFFCEMLGLQGRMDLLQDDYRVLIEQKSGKRSYNTQEHQEKHYVQMLLYQALLHYSFGKENKDISSYLLYSKYPDGLLKEGSAPKLLRQAIELRNQIVWIEYMLSRGGSRMLERLTPEKLRTNPSVTDRFWERYLFPTLSQALGTLQQASPLAKEYFHRMTTFIAREHLLSKIGTPGREGSGMAALWNSNVEEKQSAGNILLDLKITNTEGREDGIEYVTLESQTAQSGMEQTVNFRVGDVVVLYPYREREEPDVRKGPVLRAGVEDMQKGNIRIRLRNIQKNKHLFQNRTGFRWAVEHDTVESSFGNLYHSIYSILTATESRRQLLLGQRKPEHDSSIMLFGEYGTFNPLVTKAVQAKDFFILIGPPGTGKTSFGLMNILRESLLQTQGHILLVSYTNRAVDEMCSKLVEAGLDFLRFGSLQNCQKDYRCHLFEEKTSKFQNIQEIRELIDHTRIFIGTTTSISSRHDLFSLVSFDTAIVDEASQILEPHLLGILCAKHNGEEAVKKFILIGDHKQLPAVVQQDKKDSAVQEEILKEIGLLDCRESLFQRLLRLVEREGEEGKCFYHQFEHQGRMHPEVADFASKMFYHNTLCPIPLPHQEESLHYEVVENNPLQKLLATRRILFLPAEAPKKSSSPKTNKVEAKMIAEIVWHIYQLYTHNGKTFLPEESVGIIVPYRHQIALIRSELEKYDIAELASLTIDTVERYQGSQRDVIVYGFTVQRPYQMEFLCSQAFEENGETIDRKLNVALTRAKKQTILVGNPKILRLDPLHRKLIDTLQEG